MNKTIGMALGVLVLALTPCRAAARAPTAARSTPSSVVGALLTRHGFTVAPEHRQLLLVTTASWTSSHARLQRFVRLRGRWRAVGAALPARVGGKGLAWGRGLHVSPKLRRGQSKVEGDRRSPAGVFALGQAFGARRLGKLERGRWPWRWAGPKDRWVDDASSSLYNSWQRFDAQRPHRWRSAEKLAGYQLAIVIAHNLEPVVRGAGSAIFLHNGDLGQPSVGCTVLRLRDLKTVLRWLRPQDKPVIVQLPAAR